MARTTYKKVNTLALMKTCSYKNDLRHISQKLNLVFFPFFIFAMLFISQFIFQLYLFQSVLGYCTRSDNDNKIKKIFKFKIKINVYFFS